MLKMIRIDPPHGAPDYARQVIDYLGDDGEASQRAFEPLLAQIHASLDAQLNTFVNDPRQCFSDEEQFPCRNRLSGHYYIGSQTFEGYSGDGDYQLWIQIRCLEQTTHAETDYLGLEVICSFTPATSELLIEESFNTSVI
ncbi:hypothetical protein K5Q02_16095 [Pseudomonas sp. MM211]|uniref:hypothetical protein n=1 Tax=Pseudomonas sp. MM211 TaxID=2866808 RepID=UPI001CEDF57D|nr:hypothetical protein [Pseudomonas sp. MM211]UCJ15370.1 hypothetical protein K5Q02_16095 [Pseudomonas sp. MM211]